MSKQSWKRLPKYNPNHPHKARAKAHREIQQAKLAAGDAEHAMWTLATLAYEQGLLDLEQVIYALGCSKNTFFRHRRVQEQLAV